MPTLKTILAAGCVVASANALCTPDTPNADDYTLIDNDHIYKDLVFATYFKTLEALTPGLKGYETPITLRFTSLWDAIHWNCVAAYSNDYLDGLRNDGARPIISDMPEEVGGISLRTSEARVLCYTHGVGATLNKLNNQGVPTFTSIIKEFGYDIPTDFDPEVESCYTDNQDASAVKACLEEVAKCANYTPKVVGNIIARDAYEHALNDGWNMDGTNEGKCTANCVPYSDTTGYYPVNHPSNDEEPKVSSLFDLLMALSRKNLARAVDDKFRWQPLLEHDGKGFFYRQQHVTPHIGITGAPRLFTKTEIDNRRISGPRYNYRKEADLVVERVGSLDDELKMQIEFFDDKIEVAFALLVGYYFQYPDITYEQYVLMVLGYTASEYDGILLAWKEKVRFDRVRPTTIVQNPLMYDGPTKITTWGGPNAGVKEIDAKDFQPYIRVMPHAEYPSGSGCICQAASDFLKTWIQDVEGPGKDLVTEKKFGPNTSNIEENVPANEVTLTYPDLKTLKEKCGESRLDGGMHFTASVPKAYQLCEHIGSKAFEYTKYVLNGQNPSTLRAVPTV